MEAKLEATRRCYPLLSHGLPLSIGKVVLNPAYELDRPLHNVLTQRYGGNGTWRPPPEARWQAERPGGGMSGVARLRRPSALRVSYLDFKVFSRPRPPRRLRLPRDFSSRSGSMCILRPPQYNAALVFCGLYLRYLHVVRYWYNDYKLWMYMDGGAAPPWCGGSARKCSGGRP